MNADADILNDKGFAKGIPTPTEWEASASISLKKLLEATMQILKQDDDRLFLAKKPDFRESPFKEAYQKDILEIFGK